MNRIVGFNILDIYRLWLKFQDGFEGNIDVAPFLQNGFAKELLDVAEFKKAYIESGGGIAWPNGYDMCPNFIRKIIEQTDNVA